MVELEKYNRSFEEHIHLLEEEAETKLRAFRQQCVRNLAARLEKQQKDWDATFKDILNRSQEISASDTENNATCFLSELNSLLQEKPTPSSTKHVSFVENPTILNTPTPKDVDQSKPVTGVANDSRSITTKESPELIDLTIGSEPNKCYEEDYSPSDPYPPDMREYFTNITALREFLRVHELLERNRQQLLDFNSNPAIKSFKNELNLFIRTQINSISNSDSNHLDTKIKLLVNLFSGHGVRYQDRTVDASKHPLGQLFALDVAAQIFVTVGTRLVNSVPAIAKSMATVINGIIKSNLPLFKDLILGHLQERCPFLVPMYPKRSDHHGQKDEEVSYMVACGYSYDAKTQTLESEEKYLTRIRSMVLIYACILTQDHMDQAWTWLASFLSLKPRPIITATVLQAFLQETSKAMSLAYGRQYKKILAFIKSDYVPMIETVTTKTNERQSLIKLKNLLADESNLISAPPMSSIFGAIKYS